MVETANAIAAAGTAAGVEVKKPKLTFTECVEQAKAKQRAKYEAEFGTVLQPAGSPAWEIDEANNRFICHVTRCACTTPLQIWTPTQDINWPDLLKSSGLVLDPVLVERMRVLTEERRKEAKLQNVKRGTEAMLKRMRHFANALCTVALKTAQSCLQDSGKWPKNLEGLGKHCNSIAAELQGYNAQLPGVQQLCELHSLCCHLSAQIYGGDVTWPDTANGIIQSVTSLTALLAVPCDVDSIVAAPARQVPVARPPAAVPGVPGEEKKLEKARNRAEGYLLRLKKLAKKVAPMCLSSAEGWANGLASMAQALNEIAEQHTSVDPNCEAQVWLEQLQEEARLLCETAQRDDPAWPQHAEQLLAMVGTLDGMAQGAAALAAPVAAPIQAVTVAPRKAPMAFPPVVQPMAQLPTIAYKPPLPTSAYAQPVAYPYIASVALQPPFKRRRF